METHYSLIIAWVVFLFRYWQGKGEMMDAVKLAFLKYLKKESGNRIYDGARPGKIHRIEMEVNVNYIILDGWAYAYYKSNQDGKTTLNYHSFDEVDSQYKSKWKAFKWKNRTYLNYFLPVGFAIFGLISMVVIFVRMIC